MAAGGIALAWIAYRLITDRSAGPGPHVDASPGFWSAMRTIMIADATMGIDNVLAVAGAAQGNIPLVVLGLVLTVPIIVWGSALVLRCMERLPWLLYAGGAVLAWTAAAMITEEAYVARLLARSAVPEAVLEVGAMAALLGLAWLRNRRPPLPSRTAPPPRPLQSRLANPE